MDSVRNNCTQNRKFVTLNSSRTHKILIFFTVADWDVMGCVKRKHVGKLYNHFGKLSKHELVKLSVKLLVFYLGFKTSADKYLKYSTACFKSKYSAQPFVLKSTMYSLKYNLIVCNPHFLNSSWSYSLRYQSSFIRIGDISYLSQ